jgi:hypothetical protein
MSGCRHDFASHEAIRRSKFQFKALVPEHAYVDHLYQKASIRNLEVRRGREEMRERARVCARYVCVDGETRSHT